jgi:nucleoside-triphosphatase
MDMTAPRLWTLTGPRGVGKTTFCRLLAGYARTAGWDVAGLISPTIVEEGLKTGILAEDLRIKEQRPMASVSSHPPFDLQLGKWFFDCAALDWGNHVLENCLPCDLLIVDELGPLELLRGEGWTAALSVLRQPTYRLGLIVVRPELQETARARLPVAGTIFLDDPLCLEGNVQTWWELLKETFS